MSGCRQTILSIIFLFLFTGCSAMGEIRPTEFVLAIPTETSPAPVLNQGTDIRTIGKVILTDELNLSFPIAGMVEELLVEEGEYVQENEVIARLDTTVLNFEMASAQSELAVAKANLERVKAGPSKYEIVEAENAVTAAESEPAFTSAETTARAAKVAAAEARLDYLRNLPLPGDIAVAEAEVEKAGASVNLAKARLDQSELISPRTATVVNIFINPHEYTWTGDPVVQLGDLNRLSVETEMYDFEIIHVKAGDKGLVTFEALPGVEVEGIVKSIMPNETGASRGTFIVTIQLSKVPEGLQRGMTAYVVIPQ
jgi:multidrug efflux pump subunit AcrA (membrane-fusion protein)